MTKELTAKEARISLVRYQDGIEEGKAEEKQRILEIIEELLRVWGPFNPFAIDLKSKIEGKKK